MTKGSLHLKVNLWSSLALGMVIAISILSGWRDWGADRGNYLLMYNGIVESEDIFTKLFYAKDLSYLALTFVSANINDDPKTSFLLICTIALLTKFFAIKKVIPNRVFAYIFLYGFFLAPGLEFAAMRSGLAVGFLLLMIAHANQAKWRLVFGALSAISHISFLPIVFVAQPRTLRILSRWPILYFAISVALAASSQSMIKLFPHWIYYEDAEATIFSLINPALTAITAFLIFKFSSPPNSELPYQTYFFYCARIIVWFLISLAFGMALTVPAASTRFLEMAWCLMLPSVLLQRRVKIIGKFGILLFFILLIHINILRSTWLAIIDPSLTS